MRIDGSIRKNMDIERSGFKSERRRFFLRIAADRKEVSNEVLGLLKIHNGSASLELVQMSDKRWMRNKKVRIMAVMLRKDDSSHLKPRDNIRWAHGYSFFNYPSALKCT